MLCDFVSKNKWGMNIWNELKGHLAFHDAEFVGDSLPVDEMDMYVFRNGISPKIWIK